MPETKLAPQTARRSASADPESSMDPLCAAIPLPHSQVLYPHGFPVHIHSNDAGVIRAAEMDWGGYRTRYREDPLDVRIVVAETLARRKPPTPVFRAQAHLLVIVSNAENFACCDLESGFAFACLTKAAVVHQDYLRYHYLAGIVYSLLDTKHLVALHAACVSRNGRGVLLVGESGAGKSTLAYACARSGWTYISDDASSIVRRRTNRIVLGNPQRFRFRPEVSSIFPELQGKVKPRNGKPTMELRTEQLRGIQTAPEAHIDFVIFLKRTAPTQDLPSLAPIAPEVALKRLYQQVWPAELPIHRERLQSVEQLLQAHLYEMTYQNLTLAISLLDQLTEVNP